MESAKNKENAQNHEGHELKSFCRNNVNGHQIPPNAPLKLYHLKHIPESRRTDNSEAEVECFHVVDSVPKCFDAVITPFIFEERKQSIHFR